MSAVLPAGWLCALLCKTEAREVHTHSIWNTDVVKQRKTTTQASDGFVTYCRVGTFRLEYIFFLYYLKYLLGKQP